MSQPNLEQEVPQANQTPVMDSGSMGAWPEPGRSRLPMVAVILSSLSVMMIVGSAAWQFMLMKQLKESMTKKMTTTLTKALDEEQKKNDIRPQVTEALERERKQSQEELAQVREEMKQLMSEGIASLSTRIDRLEKPANRAPASKKGHAAAKKRRH